MVSALSSSLINSHGVMLLPNPLATGGVARFHFKHCRPNSLLVQTGEALLRSVVWCQFMPAEDLALWNLGFMREREAAHIGFIQAYSFMWPARGKFTRWDVAVMHGSAFSIPVGCLQLVRSRNGQHLPRVGVVRIAVDAFIQCITQAASMGVRGA